MSGCQDRSTINKNKCTFLLQNMEKLVCTSWWAATVWGLTKDQTDVDVDLSSRCPASPTLHIRVGKWLQQIITTTKEMLKIVLRKSKASVGQNMGHVINLQAPSQLTSLCDLTVVCKHSSNEFGGVCFFVSACPVPESFCMCVKFERGWVLVSTLSEKIDVVLRCIGWGFRFTPACPGWPPNSTVGSLNC